MVAGSSALAKLTGMIPLTPTHVESALSLQVAQQEALGRLPPNQQPFAAGKPGLPQRKLKESIPIRRLLGRRRRGLRQTPCAVRRAFCTSLRQPSSRGPGWPFVPGVGICGWPRPDDTHDWSWLQLMMALALRGCVYALVYLIIRR